jgi:hypothetical protein
MIVDQAAEDSVAWSMCVIPLAFSESAAPSMRVMQHEMS